MDKPVSSARETRASRIVPVPRPSATATALAFFREFLRAPSAIGSIIPSSSTLVRAMLAPVDWERCRLFVEYGPGLGTFTYDILERLAPDARLIVIDTNPRFITHLRAHITDPRFEAVEGSAADVEAIIAAHGHQQADFILSGLPFSTLPKGVGNEIVRATRAALRPGGAFLVYQYSTFVMRYLKPHFARIDTGRTWRNIPPCRIFLGWA